MPHDLAAPEDLAVPEELRPLVAAAQAGVESGRIPACQVALARDGELVLFTTLGAATNATRFRIYSATKPFVAAAIWLLIGDGKLDVSRRVVDYIPEFATNGKDVITVEQVMLHTSGFPNAPMPLGEAADAVKRAARFARWRTEWEPGSRFEYHATSAHWVLADLIERLTNTDFRDFVAERVTGPVGIPRLLGVAESDQTDLADPVVIGEPDAQVRLVADALRSPGSIAAGVPGGGAVTTAACIVRFYQALLDDRAGLWDPAVLADATTNIRCRFEDPLFGVPVNRSLGLVLAGDDGKHRLRYAIFGKENSPGAFGHAGAYLQVAWADPASGVSFAYLNNAVDADPVAAAVQASRISTLATELTR